MKRPQNPAILFLGGLRKANVSTAMMVVKVAAAAAAAANSALSSFSSNRSAAASASPPFQRHVTLLDSNDYTRHLTKNASNSNADPKGGKSLQAGAQTMHVMYTGWHKCSFPSVVSFATYKQDATRHAVMPNVRRVVRLAAPFFLLQALNLTYNLVLRVRPRKENCVKSETGSPGRTEAARAVAAVHILRV